MLFRLNWRQGPVLGAMEEVMKVGEEQMKEVLEAATPLLEL